MAKFLTRNQQIVLDFIKSYISFKGQSPSLGELQKELQIKTKRGVVQYLNSLEKKGYLKRSSKSRGISLVDQHHSKSELFETVPIVGYANAGDPLSFAYEDTIGSIQVERALLPSGKKPFALIIKGDSMNRRRINHTRLSDGNYVVVSKDSEVYDGDVVLAVIDDAATIKTFKRSANTIILFPESNNPIHKPIYLHEESKGFINGKVVAVLDNTSFQNLT